MYDTRGTNRETETSLHMARSASAQRRTWSIAGTGACLLLAILVAAFVWSGRLHLGTRGDALAEARTAFERGHFATAAQMARARLRESKGDTDALRLLARCYTRQGRFDLAQDIYHELTVERMEADDCVLLANMLSGSGETAAAQKLLESALEKEPDHPETLAELARLFARSDRLLEAQELARRLSLIPGWEAHGWVLQGILFHELSQPERASEVLARAISTPSRAPGEMAAADVRKLLARAQLAQSQPEAALETLAPLLDGASSDSEAVWLSSRAFLQKREFGAAERALERSAGHGANSPLEREPSPYAGAAACATCHKDIYDSQQSSHHAHTFARAADMERWSLPREPVPDRFDSEVLHELIRLDQELVYSTTRAGQKAGGTVDFVFGSGDRGATPVGRDEHGALVEFRLSYYGADVGWDVTTGHPDLPSNAATGGPGAFLGRRLTRDIFRRCFECHTTDAHLALQRSGPTAADHGIGCERCHGPGGNHVVAMNAAPRLGDLAIARPRLANNVEVTGLCARCHSPRGNVVEQTDPLSIRFQGSTLTWSRCFTQSQGSLSCVSCHDPHTDARTEPAYYEQKCLDCHAPARVRSEASDLADNTRSIVLPESVRRVPCPVNERSGCIECHMPERANVIRNTRFTDHFIRVHDDRRSETDLSQ